VASRGRRFRRSSSTQPNQIHVLRFHLEEAFDGAMKLPHEASATGRRGSYSVVIDDA
jgi:hypothetical protein